MKLTVPELFDAVMIAGLTQRMLNTTYTCFLSQVLVTLLMGGYREYGTTWKTLILYTYIGSFVYGDKLPLANAYQVMGAR